MDLALQAGHKVVFTIKGEQRMHLVSTFLQTWNCSLFIFLPRLSQGPSIHRLFRQPWMASFVGFEK